MKKDKKNDIFWVLGILLFMFSLVLVPFLLYDKEPIEVVIVEKKEIISVEKEDNKKELPEYVIVQYEIEYGTIYTGAYTPIIHKGLAKVPVNKEWGIWDNGLPIRAFVPQHSIINFKLNNGKKALLRVGCWHEWGSNKVNHLLETDIQNPNIISRAYMEVDVDSLMNGNVLVKASPISSPR